MRCVLKRYDYLIVGSGLFGAVFAYEATNRGKKCLIIEKRNHVGGNVCCEKLQDIIVHKYGAHIFHTNNKKIWDYVNKLCEFNRYTNSPIANYKGEIYNLPFNMNTFNKLWGVITPKQAMQKIKEQSSKIINKPKNLEEQAISLVGEDIYFKLIKGYTEKQWGRDCKDLPAFIIKRIPVRYTFDNNYFDDLYQGIPIGGYNVIVDKLLQNCDVELSTDFNKHRERYKLLADKIVYTGTIDSYYDYKYGQLEYRSLKFEIEKLDISNYQGVAVVNYTDKETPFTRVIEHKHFEYGIQPKTIITREYPVNWDKQMEPYYPVNDEKNHEILRKYLREGSLESNTIFGGRLAQYKYYDMDQVIDAALQQVNKEFKIKEMSLNG